MKRTVKDLCTIVKLKSFWRIDRRSGNYELPSGETLYDYVQNLVWHELESDEIMPSADGETLKDVLRYDPATDLYTLLTPFGENETVSGEKVERDVRQIARKIIGR